MGGEAAASARDMGARAYAAGDHVVLGESPDLRTVAHEAAHVVQQRGGVQLEGGVGQVGDPYERNADEVADRVVRGECAERLLEPSGSPGDHVVQRGMIVPIGDIAPKEATPQEHDEAAVIRGGAARLHDATGHDLTPLNTRDRPLANLGDTEELTIVAHGGSPDGDGVHEAKVIHTFGRKTPAQLVAALIASGLRQSYKGTIYLNGCNTATASRDQVSYAERFQAALLQPPHRIRAAVHGNRGPTRILEDGQTGFRKEDADSSKAWEEHVQFIADTARVYEQLEGLRRAVRTEDLPARDIDDTLLAELGVERDSPPEIVAEAVTHWAERQAHDLQRRAAPHVNLPTDALYEPRPDLITRLPRPPSDDERMVKFFAKVVAVLAVGMIIALRLPMPYAAAVFLLAVAVTIYMYLRDVRGQIA